MKKTVKLGLCTFALIWVTTGGAALWSIVFAPQSIVHPASVASKGENEVILQEMPQTAKDLIAWVATEASLLAFLPELTEDPLLPTLMQNNDTVADIQNSPAVPLYNATEGAKDTPFFSPDEPVVTINSTSLNGTKASSDKLSSNNTVILPDQPAQIQEAPNSEVGIDEEGKAKKSLPHSQRNTSKIKVFQTVPSESKRNGSPVIAYSEANRRGAGNAVRGSAYLPSAAESQAAIHLPADWNTSRGNRALRLYEQDSTVSLAVIEELAEFLGRSYWPVGTHPMARYEALTSANMQWVINRYGLELHGFRSIDANDSGAARRQLLDYLLMPSMVNALYRLYSESFVRAMGNAIIQQRRVVQGDPYRVSSLDVAGMYSHYAMKSFAFAGAMRGYLASADIKAKVAYYVTSERLASEAHTSLFKQQIPKTEVDAIRVSAKQYQAAIWQREISKQNLAAAMRRGGNTRGLTSDELVYLAQWMTRRHSGQQEGLAAVANMLEQLSVRLEQESDKFHLAPQRP